jgi:hypothetical protein
MHTLKFLFFYRHIVMKSLKRKPVLVYIHDAKLFLSSFIVLSLSFIIFVRYV